VPELTPLPVLASPPAGIVAPIPPVAFVAVLPPVTAVLPPVTALRPPAPDGPSFELVVSPPHA
jgi:hypothetical protein